ncbi:MAG: hypothetical protein ACLUR5_08690 [Eubacterium ventriosum]
MFVSDMLITDYSSVIFGVCVIKEAYWILLL